MAELQNCTINSNDRPRRSKIPTSKAILSAVDLNHEQSKCKNKRFKCKTCKKIKFFSTHRQLQRHVQKSHKIQEDIICEICSQKLRSKKYFKRHMLTRHPAVSKRYICDFDGQVFAAKDYIRIHMDRHRQHQIHTCKICQKSYISKHTFRRHLKMHIEKHVCSCCGLVFKQKLLLENHYASKHSDKLPFPCQNEHCTRLFPNKTARNNHNYNAHRNTKDELKFKCLECNIFFEMKEELRIHSFIHFNGEIKTCLECHQIFKSNRLLKIHMQKHEKKKSFQCSTCGDQFTFKTGLSKHIRLNRCRGPNSDKTVEKVMNEKDIAEIARGQLREITQISRKFGNAKEEINVMIDIEDNSETSNEDDCNQSILSWPEEKTLVDCKTEQNQTQKVIRKRTSNYPLTHKTGRAHVIYTCDFCGENIKFKKEILNHMKIHTSPFKYKCKECECTFKSRKKLIDHSWLVHEVKLRTVYDSFSCEICEMKFDVKSIYEVHRLSHNDKARCHVCSICFATFKSTGNLTRHKATHVASRDYCCPDCHKTFKTQLALKVHTENVHAEIRVFVNCSICKAIVQEKHLKIHMKNQHTEEGKEKPFSCTKCFKTFKTEKLGQRHYEAVHDPKPQGSIFLCTECPSLQFYRHRDLKEHSFIHFNGVIHQCNVCFKMFKSKRLLITHSAVHSEGDGNYHCEFCDIKFKTRGGRRKHIIRQHNDQVSANN